MEEKYELWSRDRINELKILCRKVSDEILESAIHGTTEEFLETLKKYDITENEIKKILGVSNILETDVIDLIKMCKFWELILNKLAGTAIRDLSCIYCAVFFPRVFQKCDVTHECFACDLCIAQTYCLGKYLFS